MEIDGNGLWLESSTAAAVGRYSSTLFTADDRGYSRLNRSAIPGVSGIELALQEGKSGIDGNADDADGADLRGFYFAYGEMRAAMNDENLYESVLNSVRVFL